MNQPYAGIGAPGSKQQGPPTAAAPRTEGTTVVTLATVYGAIAVHFFLMAYTDPIESDLTIVQVIIASIQIFVLLAITLAFFLLTSNTTLVRLGLYDRYLAQYKPVYLSTALALLLLLTIRGLSLFHVFTGSAVPFSWQPNTAFGAQDNVYFPLWVLTRLALLLFYCLTAYSATRASFQPEYGITAEGLFS